MSQASTNAAPPIATQGTARRMLSPTSRLTTFGTTRPRKGMMPTVTSTTALITDTITRPTITTRRWSRPRLVVKSRPIPATVKRSAASQASTRPASPSHSSS